jgi:hypothetical protein
MIKNILYFCIGALLGASLITEIKVSILDKDLAPYKQKCENRVEFYVTKYDGTILYSVCKNKQIIKIVEEW